MISDVDKTIKKLLELEFKPALPFDVSFAIPDKDFVAVSNTRNTLNCYLYDISENRELRTNETQLTRKMDGTYERIPPPARVKLSYCITAWSPANVTPAVEPALDEHQLLSEVLMALLKYPKLPSSVLVGKLVNQEPPLPTTVILPNGIQNPGDFWNAIGGQLRPSLEYTITIALDYQEKETGPVVTAKIPEYKDKKDSSPGEFFIEIGGYVTDNAASPKPVAGAWVLVEETGKAVKTNQNGQYKISNFSKGEYTVSVKATGYNDITVKFQVPESDGDYNIKLIPK